MFAALFILIAMEPLEPNDSLWKLLGKAKPVEPRPNFTQNVLRAARHTPQTRGWWAGISEWLQARPSFLPRLSITAAALAALAAFAASELRTTNGPALIAIRTAAPQSSAIASAEPPLLAVEAQLESVDQVSMLLALEDTSSLSDSEISFLLY